MANRRIKRRKPLSRKQTGHSEHAPLAALAPVISQKQIFSAIHSHVAIAQRRRDYRPSDKLVFVVLGIISGAETINDINHTLRVDAPLLGAFGYDSCAEQSVIQQTLNAATAENVVQLESALEQIWRQENQSASVLESAAREQTIVTVDLDLSGMPASAKAEGSTKGYFAGKRNTYGRQLARVVVPKTQEIVTESLYPGNTLSCQVFKEMVIKMEQRLGLQTTSHHGHFLRSQRAWIRLRLDGGFGTDANINYALWRGYHILAKIYSGKRAKKLAQSVVQWVEMPTAGQKAKNQPSTRAVGWVTTPHRYGRRTRQLAIRTPNPKREGRFCYRVLVTTDMNADIADVVKDYDQRGGVPENSFCQSNQGLAHRKRRKRGFVAQQMLLLLSQLAHNLILWLKGWMIQTLQQQTVAQTDLDSHDQIPIAAIKTIDGYGIKRFVRQFLALSGTIIIRRNQVKRLILSRRYPMIQRIAVALVALLTPYGVSVSVGKT